MTNMKILGEEKIVGQYVILGLIGQGGFGVIYRVRSLSKCLSSRLTG